MFVPVMAYPHVVDEDCCSVIITPLTYTAESLLWSGPCLPVSHVWRHSIWMCWRRPSEVLQPLPAPRWTLSRVLQWITESVLIFDTGRLLHTLTYRAHSQSPPTSPTQGQSQSRCLPTQLQPKRTPHVYSHSVTPDYVCEPLCEGFVTCFIAKGSWKICKNRLNKPAHLV